MAGLLSMPLELLGQRNINVPRLNDNDTVGLVNGLPLSKQLRFHATPVGLNPLLTMAWPWNDPLLYCSRFSTATPSESPLRRLYDPFA